ncbi:putative lipase esterase protein [Phaeoacremonium minimum UCRPA7]|uniref:Putative lipase esterase protein n=1 Tax=Phaeoacremonium minimum (strain UCR-PA7) TaxID=1286976 RepID=R8B9J3_PHAM7|nr:putative lipase esterase protein [Phaeoacremonium minimum UCRPA7]EON95952.1 putative lipase esterase protein [Phaeoacremonium minimum UCRPA7]
MSLDVVSTEPKTSIEGGISKDDEELEGLVKHVKAVFDNFTETTTVEEMRAGWETLFHGTVPVVNATQEKVKTPLFQAEWITAPEAEQDRVIVYLHGGGYVIGSVESYRDYSERLSRAAKARVLFVEYRLAPENPFPAAVDDAVHAYRWVLAQGIKPDRVAIAGDSAGAALAMSVMFTAKDAGDPLPACAVPISPWVDLEHTAKTFETLDCVEAMCHKSVLNGCAQLYLGDDRRNPLASSIHGDFTDLPPIFVTVGSHETLLDDALQLVDKAKAAGVITELQIYDRQIHVFQIFASRMAAAERAIHDIGRFIITYTSY